MISSDSASSRIEKNGRGPEGGSALVGFGHVDGRDDGLDDEVDVLDLTPGVAVAVTPEAWGRDGRASNGGDGESCAHVGRFMWFVCLLCIWKWRDWSGST